MREASWVLLEILRLTGCQISRLTLYVVRTATTEWDTNRPVRPVYEECNLNQPRRDGYTRPAQWAWTMDKGMGQPQERHINVRAQSDPAEVADMHADANGLTAMEGYSQRCLSFAGSSVTAKRAMRLGRRSGAPSAPWSTDAVITRQDVTSEEERTPEKVRTTIGMALLSGDASGFFTLRPRRRQRRSQGGRMTDHICSLRAPQILRLRLWRDLPSLAAST